MPGADDDQGDHDHQANDDESHDHRDDHAEDNDGEDHHANDHEEDDDSDGILGFVTDALGGSDDEPDEWDDEWDDDDGLAADD